jgi:glycosyltransferase involved in cell wall biosynthesis
MAYAEDLMDAQVARGHEVSYFLSGRHYPFVSGPRLKRWRRRGVAMYEVVNPPLLAGMEAGTRRPDLEISEPAIESAFGRVLAETRPDVVHIQELHALPSSLIDLAAAAGVPVLMTLQDYFPLCATLRLFDADGRVCMRREIGADCVARNAAAPADASGLIASTLRYEAGRAAGRLGLTRALARAEPVTGRAFRAAGALAARPSPPATDLAGEFQRRRNVNVERLGRVDRLVPPSRRVAEIYATLGVPSERTVVTPFTLSYVERLRPRTLTEAPATITFGTLNGCASRTKGSGVMAEALRHLRAAGAEGRFRLRVLGHVQDSVRRELEGFEGVELHGSYGRGEIDGLLDAIDVGIMPSIWEECFPFAGVEQIAKGIPLIANPLGGMVEYARDGETGWHNPSCTGAGLAEIMLMLIEEPERVLAMHQSLAAVRDGMFVRWAEHVDSIEAHYADIAGVTVAGT